jgi:hypothetical protein
VATAAVEPDHDEAPRWRGLGVALLTLGLIEAAVVMIYTTQSLLLGAVSIGVTIATAVIMVVGDATLDLTLVFLLFMTDKLNVVRRWIILAAAILAVTVAQSFWDTEVRVWTGEPIGGGYYERIIRSLPINLYAATMTVLLLAFQMAYLALREQTSRLKMSHAKERATQLSALRFQLNPHFLFNALNSLSSLVVLGRSAQAEEMIARLSDFLRATLGEPSEAKVRLGDEFEMLDAYLDVERVRFQDRMEVRLLLPNELRKAMVPPFLLQPLAENAVKYGVAASRRTVTIAISAQCSGDELLLSIQDDGDCSPMVGGSGVGLANIRERLTLIYGERARLDARCGPNGGYQASVHLPFELGPPIGDDPYSRR